ncbi:MAG: PqqD family protein [Candidatus Acidiferrales bacterium]
MSEALSEQSVVVASKDQVSCELAGEAAVLNTKTGVYYGLDPVGARVWQLVQQPRRVSEVGEQLLTEYEVESQRCMSDVVALLEKLRSEGLVIEVREGAAA